MCVCVTNSGKKKKQENNCHKSQIRYYLLGEEGVGYDRESE